MKNCGAVRRARAELVGVQPGVRIEHRDVARRISAVPGGGRAETEVRPRCGLPAAVHVQNRSLERVIGAENVRRVAVEVHVPPAGARSQRKPWLACSAYVVPERGERQIVVALVNLECYLASTRPDTNSEWVAAPGIFPRIDEQAFTINVDGLPCGGRCWPNQVLPLLPSLPRLSHPQRELRSRSPRRSQCARRLPSRHRPGAHAR